MKQFLRMLACIVCAVAASTATAGNSGGEYEITTGFVMGPVNDEVNGYFGGFIGEGGASFANGFETRPAGASLEDDPTTYNPLEDGESTLTNCIGKRENSWMFEHDPPEPFEDGNGNGSYMFFQIKRADGAAFTPEEINFSRTSTLPNSPGWDISSTVSEYNIDLTGSVIVGLQYGEDGVPGTDDITIDSGPMNAEPVNEVRGLAVAGLAVPIDEFIPDMDGQEQLDEALFAIDTIFAPFDMTAKVTLYGEDGEELDSDEATVTVEPTDIAPTCAPDLDGDGMVDSSDLNTCLGLFGQQADGGLDDPAQPASIADIDGSGMVDSADLNAILAAFGEPCPDDG